MQQPFILAPRYRLDDDSVWLQGIDPSRRYWLYVNGDVRSRVVLNGLLTTELDEWQQVVREFRSLQPEETMTLTRLGEPTLTVHCLSRNCYAIASEFNGADVWHLFDQESLESLLMTSHPDWQCAPQDLALGREALNQVLNPAVAPEIVS